MIKEYLLKRHIDKIKKLYYNSDYDFKIKIMTNLALLGVEFKNHRSLINEKMGMGAAEALDAQRNEYLKNNQKEFKGD